MYPEADPNIVSQNFYPELYFERHTAGTMPESILGKPESSPKTWQPENMRMSRLGRHGGSHAQTETAREVGNPETRGAFLGPVEDHPGCGEKM